MTYQYKEYIEELLRTSGNRATRSGVVISELLEVYKKAEKYNEIEEIMLSKKPEDEVDENPIKELAIKMVTKHLNDWIQQVYKDEGVMIYLPPNKKYTGIKEPTNEVVMYVTEIYEENLLEMKMTPKGVIEKYIKPKFMTILKLMEPTREVVLHAGADVSRYQDGYTHIDIK